MKNTIDLHLHTLVSDGTATPLQMLAAAKEAGLSKISFTDHDALGAYRHFGDMFAHAKELGIELVPGIELDTDCMGKEIHLLGYGFNLADGPLNKHLDLTQKLRKERVTLQLAVINRFFGRQVVDLNEVLYPSPRGTSFHYDFNQSLKELKSSSESIPSLDRFRCPSGTTKPIVMVDKLDPPKTSDNLCCRDTLMKPHLVHALLSQGLFSEYRAAAYWVAQNAQVPVQVPKLPIADAIAMIVAAGGEAVLAHPGYIACESEVKLDSLLAELVPLGLRGLEVDYPYLGTSPAFADAAGEKKLIANMRQLAKRFKLKETRGSDAHDVEALKRFSSQC